MASLLQTAHDAHAGASALLGGSWVLLATLINLLRTYLGDLGGLISAVIIGAVSTHEPPSKPQAVIAAASEVFHEVPARVWPKQSEVP